MRFAPLMPLMMAAPLLLGAPGSAQVGVVVHGRVEDAASRVPVGGARVLSADSSAAVFTDSLGVFAIEIAWGASLSLHVEQYGYLSQRFDLADDAPSRISVLLLEPAPIELEGISVVEESAVVELLGDLRGRRNAYFGAVTVLDRTRLERFVGATVWDVVRTRAPRIFDCDAGRSGLCVRGRGRTISNPFPEVPVLICVDAWESWGAVSELETLPVESVALIEIYARGAGGIRVYTAGYLAHSARVGRFIATPLWFGC